MAGQVVFMQQSLLLDAFGGGVQYSQDFAGVVRGQDTDDLNGVVKDGPVVDWEDFLPSV